MYLTEDLVEKIKDNTSTEFSQSRLSQSSVIDLCDQESLKRIRPIISDLQKEFFVITQNVTLAASTKRYRLPKRAAARGLREIYLTSGTNRYPLAQITREEATLVEETGEGIPERFYFEADSIVFNRPLSSEMTLVIVIEVSPGKLALASTYTTVSSVDFDTGVVTVAGTPTGFGTAVPYDFVQSLNYGNAALAVGLTPISVLGTTYTFTASELPETLQAGDYFCLAGNTPIPNMPDEGVIALIHAVSCRIFRLRGDFDNLKAEEKELQNSIIYLERALSDRVEGQRQVVKNPVGLLRGSRFRRLRSL